MLVLEGKQWVRSRPGGVVVEAQLSMLILAPDPNHRVAVNGGVGEFANRTIYDLLVDVAHFLGCNEHLVSVYWTPQKHLSLVVESDASFVAIYFDDVGQSWNLDWITMDLLRLAKAELALVIGTKRQDVPSVSQKEGEILSDSGINYFELTQALDVNWLVKAKWVVFLALIYVSNL